MSGDRQVAVSLYRALRRLALQYDRGPILKSMLTAAPRRVYEHHDQQWHPLPEEHGRGFGAVVRDFLGGASAYRPPAHGQGVSMADFLRRS